MNKNQHSVAFIQVFRGIAAFMVMFYHFRLFLEPCPINWGSTIGKIVTPGGSMGVSLFFIISGFVMFLTTEKIKTSNQNIVNFFIKRFSRLFPAYFVATLIAAATIFYFKFDIYNFDHIYNASCVKEMKAVDSDNYLYNMLKSILFIPTGGPAPVLGSQTLVVGCTLNYEFYFYLMLGVSLLFRKYRYYFLAFLFLTTLVFVPLATHNELTLTPYTKFNFQYTYLNLITNPILLFFPIGIIIGYLHSKLQIKSIWQCRLLMIMSVCFVIWQYTTPFRTDHGVSMWGISLIPLVFVFAITSKNANVRYPSILLGMGTISFSLYLIHILCAATLDAIYITNSGPVKFSIYVVLTILLSTIFYMLIENRLCEKVKSLLMNNIRV